jgi:hypothetical protein
MLSFHFYDSVKYGKLGDAHHRQLQPLLALPGHEWQSILKQKVDAPFL